MTDLGRLETHKVDAVERLQAEHKIWTISHKKDFQANPILSSDGVQDWFTWQCVIPGPAKTPWEPGRFKLTIYYPQEYPDKPPKCQFQPPLFHPNVFPSGTVALSILDEDWKPTLTIKDILPGIQMLLKEPNMNNPAHAMAYTIHKTALLEYNNQIRRQVTESLQET